MSNADLYSIVIRKGFTSGGLTLIMVKAEGLANADRQDSAPVADKEAARAYLVPTLARIGCMVADYTKCDEAMTPGGVVSCTGILDDPEARDPEDPGDLFEPYSVCLFLHVPSKLADTWVKRLARWLELINAEAPAGA